MAKVEKVDPTPEDIERLLAEAGDGPIVMLNLLRYAPDGGRETYAEYAVKAQPFVEKVGGEIVFAGECSVPVVTPDAHRWDTIALVRYPSVKAFMEMVSDPDYFAITPIRTRALDAAVLQVIRPLTDSPLA